MVVFDLHTPVWLSHVTHLVWLGWVWSDLLSLNQGVGERAEPLGKGPGHHPPPAAAWNL